MADEGTVTADTNEKASVWEDFIDIFYAPSEVFERRRGRSPWPILAVLTLVLSVLFFLWQRVLEPVMALEMQRSMAEAMADNPDVTGEQFEQFGQLGQIIGLIAFVFGFPIGVVLVTLLTWGLVRMFGAAATFGGVLLVVTYAQIVRILQYAVVPLQAMFMDINQLDSVHDVSLGLARFLDQPEASALTVGLAERVDLFALWVTALIAIGLEVVIGLSRGKAWATALLVWLLASIPTLVGAIVGG